MTIDGKQFTGQKGFPTPSGTPLETGCRTFTIPSSAEYFSLIMGALLALTIPELWYQTEGGLTPDEAAGAFSDIIEDAYDLAATGSCDAMVQTPFWDEASDVDLDESAESQTWYGEVDGSLTFTENLLVWTFTGLVALATPEIGFAPAILFHTVATKFLIAQKAGDIASIIHIVLDGQEQAKIDTTGHSGEVIEVPIYGDPTLDAHDLLLWSELA